MDQDEDFREEEDDMETIRYKDLQEIQQKGISRKDYQATITDLRQFITDLGQSRDLDEFRKEVESLFRTFETTYNKVQSDFQLCDTKNKEIYEKTVKIRQMQKQATEDQQRLQVLKNSYEQASGDLDQFREAEVKTREQIDSLNRDIKEIGEQLERGEGAMIPEVKDLENLQAESAELEKEKKKNEDRKFALNEHTNALSKQIEEIQKQTESYNQMISNKNKEIEQWNAEHLAGEEKHRMMSTDLQKKREEVDRLKHDIEENNGKLNKALEKEALDKDSLEKLELELVKTRENESMYERSIDQIERQQEKEAERKKKRKQGLDKQRDELAKLREEKKALEHESDKAMQEIHFLQNTKSQRMHTKEELEEGRRELKQEIDDLNMKIDAGRKSLELKEDSNKAMEKTRNALDKRLINGEGKERAFKDLEITYKNQISRVQNEITTYRLQNQQLHKQITQLEAEKQKYSSDAIKANMKYIETVEEVKEKEKIKEDFQRRNKELEEKLKNQQKLYECVRSDRNLYSKNLLESQEEIKELDRKFKTLTNDINQLKEEKTSKDTYLANTNRELEMIKAKNLSQSGEKEKTEKEIAELAQLYKTQGQNISRLNHIITEAEAERGRQRKDYEMVISERDILGNQLIKRTDELHLLYEKIKIQQSGLAKGKIRHQQVSNAVKEIKDEISQRKKDIILAKGEIQCIDSLKKETISLYKEVQEERLKVSMLNEELKKKMNYHKWKELEGKDPATYNLIMKIHSLQRRLIAKTEELSEKDVLIKEKESLYVELKNILSKQSGPEVAEKLEVYQQNLKERMNQLKQYMKELKAYQSQVNAYKYEIERIDKEIGGLKQQYFKRRNKEAFNDTRDSIHKVDEVLDGDSNDEKDNEEYDPKDQEEQPEEELKDQEDEQKDEQPLESDSRRDDKLEAPEAETEQKADDQSEPEAPLDQ
eukprot:TRINITY_DN2544_c0_g1_i16.p1 TRINITY_DN2544_c0_g1~~TRINITY_DN2544_c0_g1_i16.p1  ORF type:complete len:941 (-),score=420.13 TRINITY_DN2544_c0_g1_i16:155-2977(-)